MKALCAALLLFALPACERAPDQTTEPDQGRNTPLNEEVDEVAKVRDQVLD